MSASALMRGASVAALLMLTLSACNSMSETMGGNVVVVGVLTAEGAECAAMRDRDGTLYTLMPRGITDPFEIGQRVRVEGVVQEISFCQQGTTISIERIDAAP